MESTEASTRPEIENPTAPIIKMEAESGKGRRGRRPFESKAGVAAVVMSLLGVLSVLFAGSAGNKSYFILQASFEGRLEEQSSRQQLMLLENRLEIQQAIKRQPSPADLQARVELKQKADDARDRAAQLTQGAESALARQVILMRAATLFCLGVALAALATLWRRRFLWISCQVFGALALLFFVGGML